MNEKNIESLKKQVMYTGFGNLLDMDIDKNIKSGVPDFQLKYNHEFGRDKVEANLNFRRSEQDNYFFNSYELQLNKEGSEPLKQLFYVNRPEQAIKKGEGEDHKGEWVNSTITLKEAYNLMEGRSVLKEFVSKESEKYANWVNIDFKEIDDKGNYQIKRRPDFDLEAKLATLPIKELSDEKTRKELIDSLQKGNRQSVTIINDGVEQKLFVEASPQFKTINRYDGSLKLGAAQRETNDQSAKQDQKEGQKAGKDDEVHRNSQRRSSRKSHGIS